MSELAFCRTCNRGRPVEVLMHRGGWRTCAVCHGDDLGETITPEPRPLAPRTAEGWWCAQCNGVVDTVYTLERELDVYLCARCHAVAERRWIPEFAADYRTRPLAPPAEPVEELLEDEVVEEAPAPRPYAAIAADIVAVVERKQAAYGDSFGKAGHVLAELYPNGIPLDKLDDALVVVRVVDKLFRIATDRDALGESPWGDIAGYALLAVRRVEQRKGRA